MKAVMYHYVREYNPELPFFRFLDVANFARQLDYFEEKFGFATKDEWLEAVKKKLRERRRGKSF